jgi:hypothetical protein
MAALEEVHWTMNQLTEPERGEFASRALGSGTCRQAQRWQGLAMKATMVLLLHLLSRLATLLGFGGTTACVGQL